MPSIAKATFFAAAAAAVVSVDGALLRSEHEDRHATANDDANYGWSESMNSTMVDFPTDYYGVDVSQPYGESTFKCLKGLNLKYAIIRCYESVGKVDPACAGSAAAANSAGMDVHAYMFPCPTCGGAAGQVSDLLSYWEEHKVNVKRLWLDIEGSQYWTSSHASNQAFYEGLVKACKNEGLKCGVYSSASQWAPIFGSTSYSYGSDLPLWFADYDGTPSFDGWAKFGGWSKPTLKQFTDAGSKCGCSYDISWGPDLPK